MLIQQKKELERKIKMLKSQAVVCGCLKIDVEHYPTSKPDRHYLAIKNSYEERKEISRKNGKKACKPVIQSSSIRYESAREASKITGINAAHIAECCKHKRATAGGYTWEYERSDDLSVSLA